MNMWLGYGVLVFAFVALVVIRAPYERRMRQIRVVESRRNSLEKVVLNAIVVGSFLLPGVYPFVDVLHVADYPLHPVALMVGCVFVGFYLVLFELAHNDLGDNWSASLEIKDGQTLVTTGIYRRIRHPMYAAFLWWALSQLLLIPNWIVGPANFLAFLILYVVRIPREEAMMRAQFGAAYDEYMSRTGRIWPLHWGPS